MKLEIKHLAPYLPYSILCTANDGCFISHPLEGLHYQNELAVFDFEDGEQDFRLTEFKPLILPLIDLPIGIVSDLGYRSPDALIIEVISGNIPAIHFNNLVKHHYDVFGLIGAGLAIDKTNQ